MLFGYYQEGAMPQNAGDRTVSDICKYKWDCFLGFHVSAGSSIEVRETCPTAHASNVRLLCVVLHKEAAAFQPTDLKEKKAV